MKLKNITVNRQQINYIDGSCEDVLPGKEKIVDEKKIHGEEMQRLRRFFVEMPRKSAEKNIEKPKEARQTTKPTPKSENKKNEDVERRS